MVAAPSHLFSASSGSWYLRGGLSWSGPRGARRERLRIALSIVFSCASPSIQVHAAWEGWRRARDPGAAYPLFPLGRCGAANLPVAVCYERSCPALNTRQRQSNVRGSARHVPTTVRARLSHLLLDRRRRHKKRGLATRDTFSGGG